MTTLILLAALAQCPPQDDFYMMMAQENWVMDQAIEADEHAGFERFMPREVAKQVLLFREDCFRCRRRARDEVVAMGPDALRLMFWSLRSIDWCVSTTSEQAINLMIRCPRCDGEGYCYSFKDSPDPRDRSGLCWVCGGHKEYHDEGYYYPVCSKCVGRGVFPASFDEDALRIEYAERARNWIMGVK